jgi:ABC-type nitrate/sulfonate/bicarbonate transport system substrate-binding protein
MRLKACAVVDDLIPFKVGISEAVNTALAIWMADAKGRYAAAGLAVEIIDMGGGSRGVAELAAGRIDAMHVGLSAVVRANGSGGDLRVIASLANVIRFTLFSAPGLTSAAALRGGVVGVSSLGSESDAIMTLALQRIGLARDDVAVKECGGGTQRLAALKAGEIVATAVNEPVASLAREQGLHVLLDLVPEQIPWLFTAIVVRRETIARCRDLLARFLKATAEGNLHALADERAAKAVLAAHTGIADPTILAISYDDFRALAPPDLEPTRAAVEGALRQFPAADRYVDGHVDASILDDLRRDGFSKTLRY